MQKCIFKEQIFKLLSTQARSYTIIFKIRRHANQHYFLLDIRYFRDERYLFVLINIMYVFVILKKRFSHKLLVHRVWEQSSIYSMNMCTNPMNNVFSDSLQLFEMYAYKCPHCDYPSPCRTHKAVRANTFRRIILVDSKIARTFAKQYNLWKYRAYCT